MNTSLINPSSSLRSTSTRVTRKPDQIQKKSDFYHWFFGQVHVKRYLIFVMFGLTCFSLSMLAISSSKETTYNFIHKIFGETVNNSSSKHVEYHSVLQTTLNLWSFCCLLSILSAGWTLRSVEKNYHHKICNKCFNPAILLAPMLFHVLTLAFPIGLWFFRAYQVCIKETTSTLDIARFIVIPSVICFICFCYAFYGLCIAFIYLWCRAKADQEARKTAAASFRSFRDRSTLIGRQFNSQGSLDKSSRNRFTVGRKGSINRTYGTAPRPTLSSIFKDQNISRSSSFTGSGDFPVRERRDIETGVIEMGTLNRRPLETVIEENEFHSDS